MRQQDPFSHWDWLPPKRQQLTLTLSSSLAFAYRLWLAFSKWKMGWCHILFSNHLEKLLTWYFLKSHIFRIRAGRQDSAYEWQQSQKYLPRYSQYRSRFTNSAEHIGDENKSADVENLTSVAPPPILSKDQGLDFCLHAAKAILNFIAAGKAPGRDWEP